MKGNDLAVEKAQQLQQARVKHRRRSVRWGYIWALWCAIFWGAWYLPGTAIWYVPPFSLLTFDSTEEFLTAAAIISALNAVGVLIFLFLWLIVLEKVGEFIRTIRQFSKISKWYFLAAIFGGPCALFGSYLAIGYVGPIFAAVASLLYPIVGATLARLWYNEKITLRAAIGILIIIIGGVAIFVPGITGETASTSELLWIGYLGGAMSAFGWGVEGAVAGRVLDVSDADVGITIRFVAEVFYWLFLLLPAAALTFETPVYDIVWASFNFWSILWLMLAGLTFAFCYVAWYKSFPLIGVGRGQAVGDLHGIFTVIFLAIFAFEFPEWNFALGLVLTMIGGFLMISESSEVVEVVRAPVEKLISRTIQSKKRADRGKMHMKGFILQLLVRADTDGLWDHQIMQEVTREYGRRSDYWKGEVRATLTDLYSGALIEEAGEDLDDGSHFGAGKVLMKYRISNFGTQRMVESRLY